MKTVKELLQTLPEPYRSMAIKNSCNYKGLGYAGDLRIALLLAFDWNRTPQGSEFWEEVVKMCKTGKFYSLGKRNKPRINKRITSKIKPVSIYSQQFQSMDEALEFYLKKK